jgi:hypothetical protein
MTVMHEGRVRTDPRAEGMPWLADAVSFARALAGANGRLAAQ